MARTGAVYEIVDVATHQVLSRHRTRRAAIDIWREQHTGLAVQVWRRSVSGNDTLVVEGTWHEARRQGEQTA